MGDHLPRVQVMGSYSLYCKAGRVHPFSDVRAGTWNQDKCWCSPFFLSFGKLSVVREFSWGCWMAGKCYQDCRVQRVPSKAVPWGSPAPQWGPTTKSHLCEALQEGRRSFHLETISSLVWKPGDSYLAALQERLARHSLLPVFQEGDERKFPTAFPKGRRQVWVMGSYSWVRSLQAICLSVYKRAITQPV